MGLNQLLWLYNYDHDPFRFTYFHPPKDSLVRPFGVISPHNPSLWQQLTHSSSIILPFSGCYINRIIHSAALWVASILLYLLLWIRVWAIFVFACKCVEMQVWSLCWKGSLEEGMETHSSVLAWRIPWTEEPGGVQSMGSQRVGHDWVCAHIEYLTQRGRSHTHVHDIRSESRVLSEAWLY